MKRLTFVLVTTLLVVGAIAMLPQAVSAQVRVLSLTKTLPADGTRPSLRCQGKSLLSTSSRRPLV